MRVAELALGGVVLAVVLFDVFEAVVVPRPTPGPRPSTALVRTLWPLWRRLGVARASAEARDRFLGTYAPFVVILLLGMWVLGLVLGYGLLLYGLRDQLRPADADLGLTLYFAATSLLTIGFGDVVAVGWPARVVALAAGASGLFIVALVITFLFSLYGSFQRREALVVTLDARAGAPPSGVRLLETYARAAMRASLAPMFERWELWATEVLDSHVSYPILAYFRSTHDYESWISAVGAVLDAAVLVITTVEDEAEGAARMMRAAGDHLVEDVARTFGLDGDGVPGVERQEFDAARERLGAAGYRLRDADAAWAGFAALRATYAARLNALALHWAVPPAEWIGDRSYLRHRDASHTLGA